jgi:hypothetical protein|tara:strand:- start:604 stop:975 length:372 start_codon:yes stop_codon:yes gene_type:complete
MSTPEESNFNIIMQKIIKKSLFTQRQIEIILKKKRMLDGDLSLNITKGAYYRQVVQSRKKIEGLYYSIILLQGLNVISLDDSDVIFRLAEQVSRIYDNSDFMPENQAQIMSVIDNAVKQIVSL